MMYHQNIFGYWERTHRHTLVSRLRIPAEIEFKVGLYKSENDKNENDGMCSICCVNYENDD